MPPTQASTLQVSSHGLTLPLFRIGVPEQSHFLDLVDQLLAHSFDLEDRQRKIREKTLNARRSTCVLFLEGLYQAYVSQIPETAVAFPHSQRFYGKEGSHPIYEYSYRNVDACYQALLSLGWISYCPGFLDQNELGQPPATQGTPADQAPCDCQSNWNRYGLLPAIFGLSDRLRCHGSPHGSGYRSLTCS